MSAETLGYDPVEARESAEKIKMEEFYFSLKKITRELYPLFCKAVENPEENDVDVDSLISEFRDEPAFSIDNYMRLRDKSGLANFMVHDLASSAVLVLSARTLLDLGDKTNALKAIVKYWPAYASSFGDILSRTLEEDPKFEIQKEPLDLAFFKRAVINLMDSDACRGRVRYLIAKQFFPSEDATSFSSDNLIKKLDEELNFEYFLSTDEEIVTYQSTLTNSIYNIVRNACKFDFQANNVNFTTARDGDELVIRICDDGVGMGKEQLDENSPNHIFIHGAKSSTEADPISNENGQFVERHGLGLADTPKRLKKNAGADILVWSRKKDGLEKDYSAYPNDNKREVPEKFIPIIAPQDKQVPVSTVFEIRLPITKKAA